MSGHMDGACFPVGSVVGEGSFFEEMKGQGKR